jgi:hypothetical protein
VTDAEWLACEDPRLMLEFLRGKFSDRRFRLVACACCRQSWPLLGDPRSRAAAERVAAGPPPGAGGEAEWDLPGLDSGALGPNSAAPRSAAWTSPSWTYATRFTIAPRPNTSATAMPSSSALANRTRTC